MSYYYYIHYKLLCIVIYILTECFKNYYIYIQLYLKQITLIYILQRSRAHQGGKLLFCGCILFDRGPETNNTEGLKSALARLRHRTGPTHPNPSTDNISSSGSPLQHVSRRQAFFGLHIFYRSVFKYCTFPLK